MKRLAVAIFVAAFVLCGCAANAGTGLLKCRVRAPLYDDRGASCGARSLVSAGTPQVWVHFLWSGPVSGRDSLLLDRGAPGDFSRTVPTGVYTRRIFAGNGAFVSCDTTDTYSVTLPATPAIEN